VRFRIKFARIVPCGIIDIALGFRYFADNHLSNEIMPSKSASSILSRLSLAAGGRTKKAVSDSLSDLLCAIRDYLNMDVAFISEFASGKRIIRCVASRHENIPFKAGDTNALADTYCKHIVDGILPQWMADTSQNETAAELAIHAKIDIGSYVGVPVRLSDGRLYGTFCCFNHEPAPSLTDRDLGMLHVFAVLAAEQIEQEVLAREEHAEIEQRIQSVLDDNGLSILYQPIFHMGQRTIAGFESLSRFAAAPERSPDVWFNEASKVDMGIALEIKAIRAALEGLPLLPDDIYISINVSPETILSGELNDVLQGAPLHRLVLEVTEHELIDRYDDMKAALRSLRKDGLRIAVDDAGAGYASFRHILNLAPDIIKLDMSLTRNIDSDRPRRALAAAFIHFSEETGSTIVAEGVETDPEFHALQNLGITKAQGFLLGRPMTIDRALALCH
jgi:EAL domain-containing protein (putative c-di-GMP-specific phosphodiesterase class I)